MACSGSSPWTLVTSVAAAKIVRKSLNLRYAIHDLDTVSEVTRSFQTEYVTHQGPATSLRRMGPSRYPRSTRRELTGMSSAPSFGRARSHVLGPHASNQARGISYTITKNPRTPQTSQDQRLRRVRIWASESVGRKQLSRDRLEPRSRHHERLERLRALVGYMRRGRGRFSFGYRGLRAALRPIEG